MMKTKSHKIRPAMNWSADDVSVGMIVCRRHTQKTPWKPEGWAAKWTHKIGFIPDDGKIEKDPHGPGYLESAQYCQIAMTDGMVYHRAQTKEQMAADLTKEDMIPMPRTWWLKMCRYLMSQSCPA